MHTVRQLTPLFLPLSYTITLDLTKRVERQFYGQVTIEGTLQQSAEAIVLHAKDLTITKALVNNQEVTVKYQPNDELHLQAKTKHAPGSHTLTLSFEAPITDAMHGLYPSYFEENGQPKELLSTQLESHSAREVFPCIDEPAAKAIFTLTLVTEPGVTAISNTPVAKQTATSLALTTTYQPTPKMSTYLLAFVVGDLRFIETTTNRGVIVRAYATHSNIADAEYSLHLAAKLLDYYDDFFGTPYPLPKCDLVCVPDFSAAAMENWGLIICRESCMLLNQTYSSTHNKKWVSEVIAHELAHQWFGNLVTMQWWDDLWLNESFAKWMEFYSLDHLYPEWRVWEQFGGTEQIIALNRDSSASVQAVRTPVNHPDELHSLFDPAIVYAKGSSLIRMLQSFIGADAFRQGLRTYIKRHAYDNATADDLWDALDSVCNKDVKSLMLPWLTQPGHPVVKVTATAHKLELSQQRFFANPDAPQDSAIWPIPLLSPALPSQLLSTKKSTITPTHKPVLINKGGSGFFHTHYSQDLLADLTKAVTNDALDPIDRQTLLADALALAKAGHTSTVTMLELLSAFNKETSYTVWQSITTAIDGVKTVVDEHAPTKPHLRAFITDLAGPQYNRLGWEPQAKDPYFDQLLRPTIIALLAYAHHPEVTAKAIDAFTNAALPRDLPSELRTIIMSVAIREQGQPAYDRLLSWYKIASGEERMEICAAIGNLHDPSIARQATKLFTTSFIKPQDLRFWFTYFMRNHYARKATWHWMQANWPWIEATFKNGHEYGDFPKYAAAGFDTEEGLADYLAFFGPKQGEVELGLTISQGLDEIAARAAWRERDFKAVREFLGRFT